MDDADVVVGVVGKPFGVRGEAYVVLDPDLEVELAEGAVVRIGDGAFTVASARSHGNRLLVAFAGIDERDAVEALRGAELRMPRGEVPLPEDARWVADLLGAEVVDASGELIGVLESVADGAAHDLLVVACPDGSEVLVPAVPELVDLTGDRIVVEPLPGLLDPDDAVLAAAGEDESDDTDAAPPTTPRDGEA